MLPDVYEQSAPAVAMVRCSDLGSGGSGFFVTPNGHFVTNNHVIAKMGLEKGVLSIRYSSNIEIVWGGNTYPASIMNSPDDFRPIVHDYGILKVDDLSGTPFLELGDVASARLADDVLCLGYPLDFDNLIVTNGIISALTRRPSHVDSLYIIRTVVSNAIIQFGNSGGPMIHVGTQKVLGINTLQHPLTDILSQRLSKWRDDPQLENFPVLKDLIEYTLRYTYVGLNHAISIEHVRGDALWNEIEGGAPWASE